MGNYFLRTKKKKRDGKRLSSGTKRNPKLNILVCSKGSVDINNGTKVTQDVAKWNDYCKTQDGRKSQRNTGFDFFGNRQSHFAGVFMTRQGLMKWLRLSFSEKKESDNAFKKKKSDKSKKG